MNEEGFFIYLLINQADNFRYVGMTSNPERRLVEHNRGDVKSTAPYAPFHMIILRTHDNRIDARKSEKYFKSGFGRKAIARMLSSLNNPMISGRY